MQDNHDSLEFSPELKRRILIAVLVSLTIGNMMILNVEVVLPTMIEEQEWVRNGVILEDGGLSESDTSLIFSIFSLAQLIFATVNGPIKNFLGAKNAIIIGFLIITGCSIGLGFLDRIHDPTTFRIVALVLRFIQGQGDTLLQITGNCIVT